MMHETIAVQQQEAPVSPADHPLLAQAAGQEPGVPLRRLLPFAVIVSFVLHAAAAAMLISTNALSEYGVLKTESEAMSIETTQTIVLESTMSEPLDTAAAATAAMPEGSVSTVEAEEIPVESWPIKTVAVDPEAVATDEEPLEVIRGSGTPVEVPTTRAEVQEPEKTQQVERETRKEKRREQAKRQRQKRQTAGGPTSRSTAAMAAASGRASASRGSVLSYAARVRAKVARHKPSGRGHRGIARVAFGVSGSGGLSYARLAKSSGNSTLDRAALSAVRRAAPFGAPPAGASPAQLRFSIPFYFR